MINEISSNDLAEPTTSQSQPAAAARTASEAAPTVPESWSERQQSLARLAERQIFFVGGAPRSGTTWMQLLLDAHPEVSCGGEGLFSTTLAGPLERLAAARRAALHKKNEEVFSDIGGYKLPRAEDVEILLGTGILLALEHQSAGKPCRAIGEKTPENVFLFPRLKRLFPDAKLIGVARDPRDVLTSAWHTFAAKSARAGNEATKTAYIRAALPSLQQGARAMLGLAQANPSACLIVTYEAMRADTASTAARLYRFLGVSDAQMIVADCVARTSFAALTGGREAGVGKQGAFFRKGIVGDWRSTLTPPMNALILDELGWMFPHFGWTP